MAHVCPKCGLKCHCGGDIDDLIFSINEKYCSHCEMEDLDEDEISECDECGGCYGTHSAGCPNSISINILRSNEGFD